MNKTKIKRIHFVGIKGVGMTPLAIIAKEAGITITGSDIADEFITDATLSAAGIKPLIGFAKEHLDGKKIDLVITTAAHGGYDNIEVQAAKAANIPVITKGQAVGEYMNGSVFGRSFRGIAVAGTHGKTTTSGMVATILNENKLDPSYIIGTSHIASLGLSGHLGKGKYFVAEADEYATEPQYDTTPQFLWQHPHIAIVTSIEYDHPDIYPTLDAVRKVFDTFTKQILPSGVLIACGDDREVQKLLKDYRGRVVTYGFLPNNAFIIKRVNLSGEQTFFWLESRGTNMGEFVLRVSGEHNVLNATAAIIAGLEAGLQIDQTRKAITKFTGSKRRLEFLGHTASGAYLFDDYAHHPTEIKKTLQALRLRFPKKKIVCIFQPHTYSRTKQLFHEFIHAFQAADTVALINIFASQREQSDPTVSSQLLLSAMQKLHSDVLLLPELSDVVKYIEQKQFKEDTVVVLMGAGDIYKVAKDVGSN